MAYYAYPATSSTPSPSPLTSPPTSFTTTASSALSTHRSQQHSSPPPLSRPKRGRRRKRPDLSNEERRQLRAAQNRDATRRSRERTRLRAQLLRRELELSTRRAAHLTAERDHLLRHVAANAQPVCPSPPLCSDDSSRQTTSTRPGKRHQGAMSLAVILNDPIEIPDCANNDVFRSSAIVPASQITSPVSASCESAGVDAVYF